MIITLTMNPSVDYLYKLEKLSPGNLNRVNLISKMVGGKGINAARVSAILGTNTIAMGIIGGNNGDFIEKEIASDKFIPRFTKVDKETRNCYVILDKDNQKTEINEYGFPIENQTLNCIRKDVLSLISAKNVSIISFNGSLPTNCPLDFYSNLISDIRKIDANIKILLDTSGKALKRCLDSKTLPDIIKPNETEIADLLDIPTTTNCQILRKEIKNNITLSKIPIIFVSLGSEGSLVKFNNTFYKVSFKKIDAINTQGSGDSTVGGILSAIDRNKNEKEIIKYGSAAGTANAMNIKTGFLNMDDFDTAYKNLTITKIGD